MDEEEVNDEKIPFDDNNDFFKETYEGLVRRVYQNPLQPAVALIHNIMYDHGTTAQEIHQSIGEHYELPCVCMKTTIYEEVKAGRIANRDITPDDLHPNTAGHALVASVIINFLELLLLILFVIFLHSCLSLLIPYMILHLLNMC